jgi:dihydrofolate synthase/folylpolyglutamate synthase
MLEDKDMEGFAAEIYTIVSTVICTTPQNPRALPAERAAEIMKKYIRRVGPLSSVAEAMDKALDMAREEDMVLVTGSNTTVGEAMQYLERVNK